MRGVRQQELSVGKKRPPKAKKSIETSIRSKKTTSNSKQLALINLDDIPQRPRSPVAALRQESLTLPHSPSVEYLDPFATHETTTISRSEVNKLLWYSLSTFFPMSFPVEKSTSEKESRMAMLGAVQRQSHIAFVAFLGTLAVHRAVMNKRTADLAPAVRQPGFIYASLIGDRAYWLLLEEAVSLVNKELRNGAKIDSSTLEACFSIVSAATIAGDFQQAEQFLQFVDRTFHGVEASEHAQAWLLLTDIKTAVGLLRRPTKALPWSRSSVPRKVLDHIFPSPYGQTYPLGTLFTEAAFLTNELRQLLADATLLCHFCEFNTTDVEGLTTHEHIIYRCKNHELEHDVMSYVYTEFLPSKRGPQERAIPALEHIVRLGILGIHSTIATVVHPGTGLGRCLTHHQKRALTDYGLVLGRHMSRTELRVMLWALFVFAQGSREQVEEPEFEYLLARVSEWANVRSWEVAEELMLTCLYVPSVQRGKWEDIWRRAVEIRVAWDGERKGSGLVNLDAEVHPRPGGQHVTIHDVASAA
jgi:hypothetical protein